MRIELKEILIKDVSNGYKNDDEEGVVGYAGKLNIRPKYQREFVYKDKQTEGNTDNFQESILIIYLVWGLVDFPELIFQIFLVDMCINFSSLY